MAVGLRDLVVLLGLWPMTPLKGLWPLAVMSRAHCPMMAAVVPQEPRGLWPATALRKERWPPAVLRSF